MKNKFIFLSFLSLVLSSLVFSNLNLHAATLSKSSDPVSYEVPSFADPDYYPVDQYDPNTLIVVFNDNYTQNSSVLDFFESNDIFVMKNLNPYLGGDTFLIDVTYSDLTQEEIINKFGTLQIVESVDYDHYGKFIAPQDVQIPNDRYYRLQWPFNNGVSEDLDGNFIPRQGSWVDLDADLARHIAGDSEEEVRVAVLDAGVDFLNPDLEDKILINSDEIRHNGIDDDGNGYIDDYYGASYLSVVINDDALQGIFGEIPPQGDDRISFLTVSANYFRILLNYSNPDFGLDYFEEHLRGVEYFSPNIFGDALLNGPLDVFNFDQYLLASPESYNHGTNVSSVVAGQTNNLFGISSLGDNVKLINFRVGNYYNDQNTGRRNWGVLESSLISGLNYSVANDADIINLSLAGFRDTPHFEHQFDLLSDLDVLVVAGAGNGGTNGDPTICTSPENPDLLGKDLDLVKRRYELGYDDFDYEYPAAYDYPNLIKVASIDCDFKLSTFSYSGKEKVDLAAPGRYVFVLGSSSRIYPDPNDPKYSFVFGTSFSTPMVAGTAALLKAYQPDLTATEIKEYLVDNVVYPSDPDLAEELDAKLASGGVLNSALPLLKVPPKNFKYSFDKIEGQYVLSWDLQTYLDNGGYWIYHKSNPNANGWRKLLLGDDPELSCLTIDVEDLPDPDLDYRLRQDLFGIVSVFDTDGYVDLEFDYPEVASYVGVAELDIEEVPYLELENNYDFFGSAYNFNFFDPVYKPKTDFFIPNENQDVEVEPQCPNLKDFR